MGDFTGGGGIRLALSSLVWGGKKNDFSWPTLVWGGGNALEEGSM